MLAGAPGIAPVHYPELADMNELMRRPIDNTKAPTSSLAIIACGYVLRPEMFLSLGVYGWR